MGAVGAGVAVVGWRALDDGDRGEVDDGDNGDDDGVEVVGVVADAVASGAAVWPLPQALTAIAAAMATAAAL